MTVRFVGLLIVGGALVVAGCHVASTGVNSSDAAQGSGGAGSGSGGSNGTGGAGAVDSGPRDVPVVPPACNPTCTDFPADPILDPGVMTGVPGMFGAAGTTTPGAAGPCLLDPQSGTLFPNNWLRPRVSFQAAAGQTLFEIRVHSEHQANDLVAYTSAQSWTMPKDIWSKLTQHDFNHPLTVTVRGLSPPGGAGGAAKIGASMPSTFTIAPVSASGSIVYWTTSISTALKGFKVGDETVSPVLTPTQVGPTARCIGCHVSTPDGLFISTAVNLATDHADPAFLALRSGTTLKEPDFLTASGRELISRPQQPIAAYSAGHWKTGDRVALSILQNADIVWTDLEATSTAENTGWGRLARTGDTGRPVTPTWSHDGKTVVYTSTTGSTDTGVRVLSGVGKLMTVPYGDRKGGAATALPGGGDPSYHAYYPAFSPDDNLIAFTRAPSLGITYDIPQAEIFLLPRDGAATPTRLAANDPPACASRPSPGVTNSWPKWAPQVSTSDGTVYYWLTFSSRRQSSRQPQIFVTAVTVDKAGTVTTYPALHVWNQPASEANHTPAWDNFEIVVQ